MKKIGSLIVIVIALTQTLSAEEGVAIKEKTVTFVAKENLTLRESPPSGLFYTTGEKIGTIETGTKVVASDEKKVKTLFGESRWLMVDVIDAKTGTKTFTGWVYAGETNGKFYFKRAKDAKESPRREK
ncbi:hypothetical protein KKE26_12705 [bacterium]|nr:hypothetical protein [bacterium]MBU1627633.1 hypothetical protein [bacterium]